MIPQPPWKEIFEKFAAQHGFEFSNDQYLCQAGLAYIDQFAHIRRMNQIALIGMGQSKNHQYWVYDTVAELGIDHNDYLEVKRMIFAVQGSQGVTGWES